MYVDSLPLAASLRELGGHFWRVEVTVNSPFPRVLRKVKREA